MFNLHLPERNILLVLNRYERKCYRGSYEGKGYTEGGVAEGVRIDKEFTEGGLMERGKGAL